MVVTMCSTSVQGKDAIGCMTVRGKIGATGCIPRTHQKGPCRASADRGRTGHDNRHRRTRSGREGLGHVFGDCTLTSEIRPQRFEDSQDGSDTS